MSLLVTALGAAAANGVPALEHHVDQGALEQTRAVAHLVTLPTTGMPSSSCHGGGLVGCWTVPAPVHQAQDAVLGDLHLVAAAVDTDCSRVTSPRLNASSAAVDECSVSYRRHGRSAVVLLRPILDRNTSQVIGTLVAVHDGSS